MHARLLPLLASLLIGTATLPASEPAKTEPVRIIFDSDMSSDHDDVGDIAVLHGLASLGECRILGMMVSSKNGGTALCMDAINTFYGKPGIPIGVPANVGGIGEYSGQIAAEYPHALKAPTDCPWAKDLYRKLLAAQPDRSVTIVTTGYLVNLQALLESKPDEFSPLDGLELVRRKVKEFACAGGAFPRGDEFNFRVEPAAAYAVINRWPTATFYVPFDVGQAVYTCGLLPQAPERNPIRRVYVDIKRIFPYPSWGQIAIYRAVRPAESALLWGAVDVGHNTCTPEGSNIWKTDVDPTGDQDQSYLTERVRSPVREALDALIMLPPNDGAPSIPGQPSNLRAAAVAADRVELRWTDNSYNETGFVIERGRNGVFAPVATVAAGTTSYNDDKVKDGTANLAYRVKARNAAGESASSTLHLYSGWTEVNISGGGTSPTLYSSYQSANLRWARGGDFRPEHVTLNNDSEHGKDVAIEVAVGALGAEGAFHVYPLYQDADNWYRLSADGAGCRFEKRITGVTSQIGGNGPKVDIGNGSPLRAWRVTMTAAGNLGFSQDGRTMLEASEPLALDHGRIGLGGKARTPVWEDVRFTTGATR